MPAKLVQLQETDDRKVCHCDDATAFETEQENATELGR